MSIYLEGPVRKIVWAVERSGRRRAEEFFDNLDGRIQRKFEGLFRRMTKVGEIRDPARFRSEGDGLYCFKAVKYRLVCFLSGNEVVITHGFEKGSDKMPKVERERALRIRKEHLETENQG